jgi:Domain of unknown function (DUF4384)
LNERHLSPLDMDALVLGATSSEENAALGEHLDRCQACREQRRAREERAAAFNRSVLARGVGRLDRVRHRGRATASWWRWAAALPIAGLVIALGIWGGRPVPRSIDRAPRVEGIKGLPALHVVARRGTAVFEVGDGAVLAPGDALRFVLEPAGRAYLIIASVDGAGRANVYFPYRGQGSARIDPDRTVEAPSGSIVLDRAPGPERIFALWSSDPLASERVLALLEPLGRRGPEAIRHTSALEVPGTLQVSVLFEKQIGPP